MEGVESQAAVIESMMRQKPKARNELRMKDVSSSLYSSAVT